MGAEPLDPLAELASFDAAAQELLRLCDGDPARLAAIVPLVSGWSALAHVAHVSLANELVLKNLASLQKGEGLLVQREATPNPEALRIIASGVLPPGAQSPRMVRPPSDLDHATARAWAAGVAELVPRFAAGTDPARLERLWIPHQVLGPLDFAQWARFGAMHTRHHLGIARAALAAGA